MTADRVATKGPKLVTPGTNFRDSIRKVFIYKKTTGNITTYKFSDKGSVPYGYDRNTGEGSFQQMILQAENDGGNLSILRVCTHKQMKTQLLIIDEECGKKWDTSDSYFVNTIPQPGMTEIWTGRRSQRPYDSGISLSPLDSTPFESSQQAFYAPVVEKIENSEDENEYQTIYQFQGRVSK
ncbi:Oidioi.mRNA.OKI2018_I69.PAR.g11688.t1.cds [Oikopleura dioica]|uniref:Oidioi.mRNA.OKI2018_I69.PAR.g11688.t1.cds n=1 Tax=Oikopleura dioica TaxID=34765 RepID=A0ABN7RZV5_OIKDI|nr:Oidioi.mRNA.OKI2018_I69.PAR.g11688.t1.cds [Oikopleura dioica]